MTFYKDDPAPIFQRDDGWYIQDIRVEFFNRNHQDLIPIREEDWELLPILCQYSMFFPNIGTLFPEVLDPDDWIEDVKTYERKLPRKPVHTQFTHYRNPYTGDKFSYRLIYQNHNFECRECHKGRPRDQNHWNELITHIQDFPESGYISAEGDAVCYSDESIIDFNEGLFEDKPRYNKNRVWICTNKKFVHRDYCSDECYKKSRERKRKDRRDTERIKKYTNYPPTKQPDGRCKLCHKDITDQRAGSLICKNHSESERRKYFRQKERM